MGDAGAARAVEPTLRQIEATDETNRRFAASARRILAGKRDPDALTDGLESMSGLFIRTVLEGVAGGALLS